MTKTGIIAVLIRPKGDVDLKGNTRDILNDGVAVDGVAVDDLRLEAAPIVQRVALVRAALFLLLLGFLLALFPLATLIVLALALRAALMKIRMSQCSLPDQIETRGVSIGVGYLETVSFNIMGLKMTLFFNENSQLYLAAC